ncbi:MAG: ATP-binding protein [Actinomycetaceae bacterium]|nr:ATP-binding protein [Actinomycetaceae bacterium]MDY6082642.1 ATP-binding protein [Actinomycetaceae bacterium]
MSWDLATLQATLDELRVFGDDTTLIECKRAAKGMPESIGESLSAFANMPEGGTILLGVDENAGFAVTGVENPAEMHKKVVSFCRQTVDPAPQLTFSDIATPTGTVVAVDVSALSPSKKPASYNGKPYLRQADGDYPMNANDLRMIAISALHETEREDFDLRIYRGTDKRQLDPDLLKAFLENSRSGSQRQKRIADDDLLLQILSVTDDSGNLRLAGLYALGFIPQATEPSLGATAAVRLSRTETNGRAKNLVYMKGPISDLIDQSMEWIQRNTDTVTAYNDDGHMVDRPEFPPTAIREIVANAFVHRDLGPSLDAGKQVEIRVSEKALVIQNPGGLRGLSVAQLESAELTKAAVNQRLYEICKNLQTADGKRVIEGEGGGIREVLIAAQQARLRPPKFIDTGVQFKVIFPRGSRFSESEQEWLRSFQFRFSPPQEDILVGLRRGESYSRSRIAREYEPLSKRDLNDAVDFLLRNRLIEAHGEAFALVEGEASAPRGSENERGLASLGKNVPIVYRVLADGGHYEIKDLQKATGLTVAQIRYALNSMLKNGLAVMEGGQGMRKTTYYRGATAVA